MSTGRPRAIDRGDLERGAWIAVQLVALGIVAWIGVGIGRRAWLNDAYGYWAAWQGGLYDIPWLAHGAYVYSPALAQAILPWTLIPWKLAWAAEVAAQVGLLILLGGPVIAAVLLLIPALGPDAYANPVLGTIHNGNAQILLAAAIAAGYRWPGAWVVPIHMKITPGIGLLWYAARREWRRLGIAVAATAGVVLVSWLVAPWLWQEWIGLVRQAAGADALQKEPILAVPLVARLPLAAMLIVWGARTDRYWTVPIAAVLALPAIQVGGFAVAVGALPFLVGGSARFRWLMPSPLRRLWGVEGRSDLRPASE